MLLHNIACHILHRFRALALRGTALAKATFTRIRLVLLKSAARLTIRKTHVQLHLGEHHPHRELWKQLSARCHALRTAASG